MHNLKVEEWLKLSTSYCNRLSAWITTRTCEVNSERSASGLGDLRCCGCNGLHDQPAVPATLLAESLCDALAEVVNEAVQEGEIPCLEEELGGELASLEKIFLADEDIEEVLAELLAEDETPDEASDTDLSPVRRARRSEKRRKVAVYMGRCPKCGGYMTNTREQQFNERDEEVYRCISCSWRTSPAYAWNRQNQK